MTDQFRSDERVLTEPTTRVMAALRARRPSARRMRLFLVACSRYWAEVHEHPSALAAVDLAEGFADGSVTGRRLAVVRRAIHRWSRAQLGILLTPEEHREMVTPGPVPAAVERRWGARWAAYLTAAPTVVPPVRPFLHVAEFRPYLADVLGPADGPVEFDPTWRTEAVVGLARGMYEGRDFGPMPVLADALEDADCADADVLAHCRGSGPHVRGCWLVDLVLGKI